MVSPNAASEIRLSVPRLRTAWRDVVGGAVLVTVLLALWSFFALGVVGPAGRLGELPARDTAARVRA